jgi:hypothetical protein
MNPLYEGVEQFDNPLYDAKGGANAQKIRALK